MLGVAPVEKIAHQLEDELSAARRGATALTPEMFQAFTRIFKALGFTYVTVDTEGFRSGSMNASLPGQRLVKLLS